MKSAGGVEEAGRSSVFRNPMTKKVIAPSESLDYDVIEEDEPSAFLKRFFKKLKREKKKS